MTIPNKISIGRLVMALLMILAAVFDAPTVFLAAFCASLASDAVDGFLARHLHQESRIGAVLDTCGDVTMYIAAAVGGWILWPELIRQEAAFIITATGITILLWGVGRGGIRFLNDTVAAYIFLFKTDLLT